MKDLVNDANFECSPSALSLQAMDTSHVALVAMQLRSDGFAHFRCDRNLSMGRMKPSSLHKKTVACQTGDGCPVVACALHNDAFSMLQA